MKWIVCAIVAAVVSVGCGGGTEASCARCDTAFTNEQCMAFAAANGCTSGVSMPDPVCGGATRGCQFQGCPAGRPATCEAPTPNDAGGD